ncbi:MAG: GNAT family N-acetyltransferase [Acidobacteria bacterium RIFCSPLOWO2_02_FULL_60_20]|nr:MAG: GNAT family N-acetyltransferase [Acidobacteria bacterium RIFCSPLOWO2_02_FULL_60_20]
MDAKQGGPAYRIHTPRLVLRCWNPSDAPLLKEAIDASLDHLQAWMSWAKQEPESLDAKIERLRRFRGNFDLGSDFVLAIFNRDESKVLGGTGFDPRIGKGAFEIGYWIRKDYINQGLATEASAAVTKVAVEIEKASRVEIHCDVRNTRSAAIPRKLAYIHEATLRNRGPDPEGKPRDAMIWTLFAEDYPASPSAKAEIEAFDVIGHRLL